MTRQPNWKLLANLGDVNFADYGGMLVYVDETGVYDPEAEYYYAPEDERRTGEVFRFSVERFKMYNGHLIPFKYNESWHYPPGEYHPWFDEHGHLESMAVSSGLDPEELRRMFTDEDPRVRARAYETIAMHFGPFELDHYPLTLTDAEGHERYAEVEHHPDQTYHCVYGAHRHRSRADRLVQARRWGAVMSQCNNDVDAGLTRLVQCGTYVGGYMQLCEPCEAKYEARYPQGWRYYPGDVCPHGVYVGGCAEDYMCGYCESEPFPSVEDV